MDDSTFALKDHLIINTDHLASVCKYRQLGCCKYIIAFPHGDAGQVDFFCVKQVPDLNKIIKREEQKMTAKGDNCKGLNNEERSQSQGASE
ncbi:hypothetical protein LCGC14_1505940 [marine sediment metagenome]|uniref:Uncharacterized protein n=1 Tax=marine sediment metagenome TaxID=412755 RepID=A0A0F9JNH8_9ZZZZ